MMSMVILQMLRTQRSKQTVHFCSNRSDRTLRAPEPLRKLGFDPLDVGAGSERAHPNHDLAKGISRSSQLRANQVQTTSIACAGAIPSALGAKSASLVPSRPTGTGELSGGSLRTLGHAIVTTMTAPSDEYVSGFTLVEPSPPERTPKPREETIILRGVAVPLNSDIGCAFVTDLSRNKERLFSDQQVCEKYDITPDDWTTITQNKALRLLVNAEHERRMLRGTAAQEAAAKVFAESPEVMGTILRDQQANPRHRIEASKELRATARFDDKKDTADTERFTITINLGNAPEDKIFVDCGPPKQPKENPDGERNW